MRALCETLAEQLRGAVEGDVTAGLSELAQLLSSCEPDEEEDVCAAVETSGVLLEIMAALARGGLDEHQRYLALSALVNLADVGGSELVLRHGGFQLLLALVDSAEPNTRYYACAGIQNMTSDPFLLSAFATDGTDGFPSIEDAEATLAARLDLDSADEALEHVVRCATGALANLRAVSIAEEYVEASDDADDAEPAADDGRPPPVPPSRVSRRGSLENKLQKALAARCAYEAHMAEHEDAAARVLQRRLRTRRAAPLDADAADATGASEGSEGSGARGRARVRAAAEAAASALRADRSDLDAYLAEVQPAMLALATQLTDVVGADDEAYAVECVRESEVVGPLLLLLLEHLCAPDRRLLYLGLSVVVNLADLGGAQLIDAHGGLELMLGLLRDADLSVRYYAVAGVQNLTSTAGCAMRVRGTPAERLLETMLDSGNEQIERCAAGALANIRRASREVREAAAATAGAAAGDVGDDVRAEPPMQEGVKTAKQRQRLATAAAANQKGAASLDASPSDATGSMRSASGGGLTVLDMIFALPASGLGLVYALVTLPLRPFFRAQARPSETPQGRSSRR